jgi:hypothetical protein
VVWRFPQPIARRQDEKFPELLILPYNHEHANRLNIVSFGKTRQNKNHAVGNQIEYEDEDLEIRQIFEQELSKRGVESRMPRAIYEKQQNLAT